VSMVSSFSSIGQNISSVTKYLKAYAGREDRAVRDVPSLSIETTNVCNATCAFCANRIMKRPRCTLDMALFKKAVDEYRALKGCGKGDLNFNTVVGEPLLDPLLLERARYVRRCGGLDVLGFLTTLQWLHRFDIDEFFSSGINWLGVSAVLSGRERYAEFFGVDMYDIFMKNLNQLLEENRRRGGMITVSISLKPTDEPASSVAAHPDLKRIASLLGCTPACLVHNRSTYVDDWHGTVELPKYMTRRLLLPRAFFPCRMLYNYLMLYSDGTIGACPCRDFEAGSALIIGDIRKMTLGEAWHSDSLAGIRSEWATKNRIPDICQRCRHWNY
jgi:radical SAM protein with 4Fe4S-binding SPASM domain